MRVGSRIVLLTLLVSLAAPVLLSPTQVYAQGEKSSGDVKELEKLATEGAQAFQNKEYAKAIEKFEAAYKIEEIPNLLYNIAKCYEKLEKYDEAIKNYKKFVFSENIAGDARKDAYESIERLEKIQEFAKKEKDAERRRKEEEAASKDEKKDDRVAEQPKVKLVEPDHTVAYILGGTGVAFIAGGVVLGLMANNQHSSFESGETTQARRDAAQKGEQFALFADIGFGVGAAALITGVVLWAVASPEEVVVDEGASAGRLQPYWSPQAAGLNYQLTF